MAVAQHGTAAERSPLRRIADGVGVGTISVVQPFFTSARGVMAVPSLGRVNPSGVNMLAIILAIVAACVLLAELWTGIAVVGWSGDNMVVERSKSPGPYWFTMAIHTLIGVSLPVLTALAT